MSIILRNKVLETLQAPLTHQLIRLHPDDGSVGTIICIVCIIGTYIINLADNILNYYSVIKWCIFALNKINGSNKCIFIDLTTWNWLQNYILKVTESDPRVRYIRRTKDIRGTSDWLRQTDDSALYNRTTVGWVLKGTKGDELREDAKFWCAKILCKCAWILYCRSSVSATGVNVNNLGKTVQVDCLQKDCKTLLSELRARSSLPLYWPTSVYSGFYTGEL